MKILIINAGSSSLKYQLTDMADESVPAKGNVERIGIDGSNLVHRYAGKRHNVAMPLKDHVEAMRLVLSTLTDEKVGVIRSMDEIGAVGHRVVHGGDRFNQSVLIDEEVIAAIAENIALAPLHNPANLMGINACRAVMPNTPMVAVFDTAFHQTMPPRAYLYGLPIDYYRRLKVRRYGFHGTSHGYVSRRTARLLGRPAEQLKIVVCHLGNGSSITAVDGGRSVDTSMGMTPLEGVIMGTRSGSIDPSIIEQIMVRDQVPAEQVMTILNKKSGLLGLSGRSSDMRDVLNAAEAGDGQCEMALDVWAYGIRKYIGAYAAAMGGLDAVVFTAGIGENNPGLRAQILEGLSFLGIEIDRAANAAATGEANVTSPGGRVQVLVVPTDEERAIARDTLALVGDRA
ncbi:MAG: acetate kinase [Clostridiales bacterium]|nr:acetate kinase [Clostridiales bacterium]